MNKQVQDIAPVIIEDFDLEIFTEGMSDEQRLGFYQGFSKCYRLGLLSSYKVTGVYRFPAEAPFFYTQLSEKMVKNAPKLISNDERDNGELKW